MGEAGDVGGGRGDGAVGAPAATDRAVFAALFDELSPRVLAYARRHCSPEDAHDVVADTFLLAWRRFEDVPADALPWLIVVARNTIANRRRTMRRQDRLAESMGRIAQLTSVAGPDHDVVERDLLLSGLAGLTDLEREAVLLVAWDGLSGPAAAAVAGCSTRAFEVRLSRARARLNRALDDAPTDICSKGRSR